MPRLADAPAAVDLRAANEVALRFGVQHHRTVAAERRDKLSSSLFDVPRRSSLANALVYAEGPGLVRALLEHTTPEAIGAAMKVPGSRPYALTLWVVLGAYLSGRQQALLDAGAVPGRPVDDPRAADLALMTDFYVRVARVYREDDELFAGVEHPTQPILAPAVLDRVLALLEPAAPVRLAATRRAAASLTLYNFMLHGEHRDGLFGHGPYPGPDGTVVWFEEFSDLRTTFLPWADVDADPLPVDNVVLVYAARDVAFEATMFGAFRLEPATFEDRVVALAALTWRGGRPVALEDAVLSEAAARADVRQALLFRLFAGWSERYRIEYGCDLFANHFAAFFELAGAPGGRDLVRERFARATPAALADIEARPDLPSFWRHFGAAREHELFSPAATAPTPGHEA